MSYGILKKTTEENVNVNINLRFFGVAGLASVFVYSLLARGLYFKFDLLPGLVFIGVMLIFAAADATIRGETDFFRFPIDYLVTGIALVYFFASFTAVSKPDAILGFLKYSSYLAVFLITCQCVRTWRSYRNLLEVFCAGAVMVALIGLFGAMGYLHYPGAVVGKGIASTFQYQNALAIFALACSLICLSLWASSKRSSFNNLWYISCLILINVVLMGTGSRAVWMMYPLMLVVWVVGLPKDQGIGMAFNTAYVLITSVLVSSAFFTRAQSGQKQDALIILLGSLLVILAGWMGICKANRIIQRRHMGQKAKTLWKILGAAYLAVILTIYMIYTVNNLPGGWDAVVPNDMMTQIATANSFDENYTSRVQFSKDAIGIIRDYPWLGTGAGGWAALYQKYKSLPYSTTEVHNNFVQVAVETGIPGFLLYCTIWAVTFYSGFRIFKHFRRSSHWPLAWGTITALIAICIHSSFDFDLSLPSLSIFTWMMFGLIRNARILTRRNSERILLRGVKRFIPLIAGLALSSVLIIPSYRLYQGGVLGADGAKAMETGDIVTAEEKMKAAVQLDPYTGSYQADIAKINLSKWNTNGQKELLRQGLLSARQAVEKEPYNINLKEALILCYVSSGMPDEALEVVYEVTTDNPLEIKAYEIMANSGVQGAMYYLGKGDKEKALVFINKVVGIPLQLEKAAGKVAQTGINGFKYAEMLRMTLGLNLSVGKAYLLAGRFEEGLSLLEQGAKNKESARWLAAAYRVRGDITGSNRLIERWSKEDYKFQSSVEQIKLFISQAKLK